MDTSHEEGSFVRSQNVIVFPLDLDIIPGVISHPVLSSRLRDVSAAQLYLNGLYGVPTNSFPVECVIARPPNLNVPSVEGSFPSNFCKFLHIFIALLHYRLLLLNLWLVYARSPH